MEREDFNGMNLNEDISDEDFNKIVEIYEQVKDKISKEDFISVFNENKKESDFAFFSDVDFAETILNSVGPEENEILDEVSMLKLETRISILSHVSCPFPTQGLSYPERAGMENCAILRLQIIPAVSELFSGLKTSSL